MSRKEIATLPLVGGKMNVLAIEQLSETPLSALLLGETDVQMSRNVEIAREIAADPALRACAESINEGLQKLARPVGPGRDGAALVYRAMEPLLVLYGRPKKTNEELIVWWKAYYDAFSGLPLAAIDYGISEFIRTASDAVHMVPVPAKIVALAAPKARSLYLAAFRVRQALEMEPPAPPITDEERAKVTAEFKDLLGKMGRSRTIPVSLPRPTGTPQEVAAALRRMVAANGGVGVAVEGL